MVTINMFSSATKVKGQGVGSAYLELIRLLKTHFKDEFTVTINQYQAVDISHYHTIDPKFFLSTFSKKRGRKIGYVHFLPETMEGSLKIPQPFKGIFYRYLIAFYKRMDHLVVVNPSFIPKLEAYQIPKERITYIPNFVSKQQFFEKSAADIQVLRQAHGFSQQDFIVLGAGQIQERKGVDDFVKLAQQNPQMQFVWAGGFSFGKMTEGYQRYRKIVADPPANLTFTGIVSRDELMDYYNMANLFLLPSYNELFPMSVLESFACGTPVMLRDLDLYRGILNGYYQPAKDVTAMNQILQRLQTTPAELAQLKHQADLAADEYSEAHLAKIWEDFYQTQSHLKASR